MRRAAAAVCNILGALLIAAVILVCLPLTVPRLLGYEVYAIVSGSMEPAISTGSLAYAKRAEPLEVAVGDVIVFQDSQGGTAITHRVVENRSGDRQFITKGDANAANDVSPVPYEALIGKVAASVPVLGYFLPSAATAGGKVFLLGILAGAVLLRVVGGILRRGGAKSEE